MNDLEDITNKLLKAFERDDVKKAVLEPEWFEKNHVNRIHSTGFCFAASEVIYRLTGGKEIWKKVSISKRNWEHGGHCFLIHKITNQIFDITDDQYKKLKIEIPYELGKAGGFRQVSTKANNLSKLAGLGEIKSIPK